MRVVQYDTGWSDYDEVAACWSLGIVYDCCSTGSMAGDSVGDVGGGLVPVLSRIDRFF